VGTNFKTIVEGIQMAIETRNYVVYSEDENTSSSFIGFADTLPDTIKIKSDAAGAGFSHVVVVDGNLNKVKLPD
jgi:hypothetical protein